MYIYIYIYVATCVNLLPKSRQCYRYTPGVYIAPNRITKPSFQGSSPCLQGP